MNITNSDNNIAINNKLTLIKSSLKLNQVEFAKKLGVAQSYLSDLEKGKREVTSKLIISLIREFNVSSDWLLADKGNMFLDEDNESFELAKRYLEMGYESKLENKHYEYRQLKYYNSFSTSTLRTHSELELDAFRHTFESFQKLKSIIHFLAPNSFLATEKYKKITTFSSYMEKSVEEDPFLDEKKKRDSLGERASLLLRILWYRNIRDFFNDQIYNCIYYMEDNKDFLKEDEDF